MNKAVNAGVAVPICHQLGVSEVKPPGNRRAASTGVTVRAKRADDISITITDNAIDPRKSPAGPFKIAIGKKVKTVVSVDEINGTLNRDTAPLIASMGLSHSSRRLRTSSAITIDPSTNRPSATTKPVTDI